MFNKLYEIFESIIADDSAGAIFLLIIYVIFIVIRFIYKYLKKIHIFSSIVKRLHINISNGIKNSKPTTLRKPNDIFAFIIYYFVKDKKLKKNNYLQIDNQNYFLYTIGDHSVLYMVELDFNLRAHIVGFNNRLEIDKTEFENYLLINNMEKISLEGDINKKFEIYARRDQGSKTHYVLDPVAIEYVAKNFANNAWEIIDDVFYLAGTSEYNEPVNYSEIIAGFIRIIKPATIESIARKEVGANEEYANEYGDGKYLCPICSKELTRKEHWLECPDGDGIMINGGHITDLYNNEISPPISNSSSEFHGDLRCPKCDTVMNNAKYQYYDIVIDSCPECPMRWLDSGEAQKIASINDVAI